MITATLATIPGRTAELRLCLESLCPQMDSVIVACNYPNEVLPDEDLMRSEVIRQYYYKLTLNRADNSMGDAMKFAHSETTEGYQFICDDDIVYPPDYAERMIAKIEEHNRRAVIGVGGSIIPGHIDSYYSGRVVKSHSFRALAADTWVNNLLTCALAFHSDTVMFPRSAFKRANMADVFCACVCQQKRLPML